MARKTLKERVDESLLEMQEYQKRHDLLMAQYNEQEEKAKSRRFAERGKVAEKALPELAALTKNQFATYVEKVMQTDEARIILMELCEETQTLTAPMGGDTTGQSGGTAVPTPTQTAKQINTPPTPKPAETPRNSGTDGSNNGGNPNRHNNAQPAQRPNTTPQNGNGGGNGNRGNDTGQQA
ncbi:MAG: hypothetical protein FWF88_07280 [Peptococcaceae bacterium]|nr:hypothetical protein [Peptococcaceae bacterium]